MMIFFRTIVAYLRDKQYRNLLLLTAVVLIIGTIAYRHLEGWTYLDSLYFSIITLTTVGYGDFSPETSGGKIFTIVYIIIGIGIILTFIDTLYQHFERTRGRLERKRRFKDPRAFDEEENDD